MEGFGRIWNADSQEKTFGKVAKDLQNFLQTNATTKRENSEYCMRCGIHIYCHFMDASAELRHDNTK